MEKRTRETLRIVIPLILALIGALLLLLGFDVLIHEHIGHEWYALSHGATDCYVEMTREGLSVGGSTLCHFPKNTPKSVAIDFAWAGIKAELLVSFILMIPFFSIWGGLLLFDTGFDFYLGAYDNDLTNAYAPEIFFSQSFRLGTVIFTFLVFLLSVIVTFMTWKWLINKID